eukprot:164212_1
MGNHLSTLKGANTAPITHRGFLAILLVSIQFGIQPFLNEWYLPPRSIKSSVVMVQECIKLIFCVLGLSINKELKSEISKWNALDSLRVALVPAAIYNIQNLAAFYSYHNLDPLVFNLMNQTKIIWSAIFLKIILNKTPTNRELLSLNMLVAVALMLCYEMRQKEKNNTNKTPHKSHKKNLTKGLIAMLIATTCSGLAGVLTQRALQNERRNTFVFSGELAVYGTLFGILRLYSESKLNILDGRKVNEHGLLYQLLDNDDYSALIPICCNVIGGVGVGMITKYTSVIHKSYALILGIFMTLLIRHLAYKEDKLSKTTTFIAVPVTVISLYLNKIQ